MDLERYNGWTNYETWAVHLWLTNDEGTYLWLVAMASEVADGDDLPYRVVLGDRIRDSVVEGAESMMESAGELGSLWMDLLSSALGRVEWFEVADAFLAEVADEA